MFQCSVCGKVINGKPMYHENICSDKCFKKDFWDHTLDETAVIVNGTCYHIGDENSPSCFRGFGGREFTIRFKKDGKIVKTTNLWHNGKVPESYHVEDNAEFVR